MADPRPPDADLLARLAAQEAAFAAYRAEQESRAAAQEATLTSLRAEVRRLGRRRFPRRALAGMLAILLVALVPLAAFAANPFTDLAPGSPHNADIDQIYNLGITKGCTATTYCPTKNVTREEMASFLARTAKLSRVGRGLGTNTIGNDFNITATTPNFQLLPGTSVAIDAPASGFVLVNASVSVSSFQTISVNARLRDVTPGAPPTAISPEISRFDAGDFGTGPLTLTYVFPVTGPGVKTFQLELTKTGGSPVARNGVITALYVPFGASGGTTLNLP